jgi:tRNA U34 2-thiouridine synthase MnmA/TrmU
VKDYWNDVFMPFLDSYRSGVETPNPDVMCNRLIKFNRFREHVTKRLGIR